MSQTELVTEWIEDPTLTAEQKLARFAALDEGGEVDFTSPLRVHDGATDVIHAADIVASSWSVTGGHALNDRAVPLREGRGPSVTGNHLVAHA
jgi:hypothetical protein